ncbi:site-specific integrase [Dyadobacter subterraneus]|uniref:Tyrosine-type recombinase/integrase n=1 Tax=Dyadobacter subterraneus TaxID=2773304 RepID=A0ABR9WAP9_9BACT|nr:site-specific integrase [Dyadobacter subterraneus]MBE9461314.1 tyrosine-type recombinase/integrase [Dyadobacter subterraneus]
MRKIQTCFDQLIYDAGEVLRTKLLRTDATVNWYRIYWRRMWRELRGKEIPEFTSNLGRQHLLDRFGQLDYATLSKRDKDFVKIVSVLCEFYDTGTITRSRERLQLDGVFGALVKQFVDHLATLRLKSTTIREREHYLSKFLIYMKDKGIASIDKVDKFVIIDYLRTLDIRHSTVAHMTLRAIRTFLKFLFEQGLIKEDISLSVPQDKYQKQAKLPSVFSVDEIQRMISKIDRARPSGKRNYAIVLIAARLGLRASDIAGLKFENLFWEQSIISICQYKTGRQLQLPLLAEVGEAIIEYLKYGRPISNEPYVFLAAGSPFGRMHSCGITNLVNRAFILSGVNIEHRHHGPHALRHSLASLLLEQSTVLPVITEVLGHENSRSTKYYLRIDLTSMKQCMLEAPAVADDFYNQKGGCFYA